MKIQITENDIRNMVFESVKKLMKEGWRPIYRHIKGPDGEDYEDYDGEEWDGVDDEEEEDFDEINDEGDIDEQLAEHDPDDRDFGHVGDSIYDKAMQKMKQNGRVFTSLEDFKMTNRRLGLEMRTCDVWINPGVKSIKVIFYPASISSDSYGDGWVIDDIDFEYGEEEVCSIQGEIQPLVYGKIKWLDDFVNKYANEHEEEIINNIYGND